MLVSVMGPRLCRLITHLDLTDSTVDEAGEVLAGLLKG